MGCFTPKRRVKLSVSHLSKKELFLFFVICQHLVICLGQTDISICHVVHYLNLRGPIRKLDENSTGSFNL